MVTLAPCLAPYCILPSWFLQCIEISQLQLFTNYMSLFKFCSLLNPWQWPSNEDEQPNALPSTNGMFFCKMTVIPQPNNGTIFSLYGMESTAIRIAWLLIGKYNNLEIFSCLMMQSTNDWTKNAIKWQR